MTTFNNPELQKAYDENKQFLEDRIARIDRISDYIRSLEANLQKLGAPYAKVTCDEVLLEWYPQLKKIFIHIPPDAPKPFIETSAFIRLEYVDLLVDLVKNLIKDL